MSNWHYNGEILADVPESIPEGAVGFVYIITRIDSGRKYIGKKLLKFSRTKVVKGKKKKMLVESDWKTYFGSNSELLTELAEVGPDQYKRDIIKFCFSKSECNYEETRHIMEHRALFSDDYYNSWVTVKVTKSHIKSALKKNLF